MYLSCRDEQLLLGNLLGDMIRNRDLPHYPHQVQKGVRLHRMIDYFTDTHPVVLGSMRRLYPQHGRYASILVDIYYDYLLAQNWTTFSRQSMPDFQADVYQMLDRQLPQVPELLRERIRQMIANNWLQTYTYPSGIRQTIGRVAVRASQPERLVGAWETMTTLRPELEAAFLAFFPELIAQADTYCDCDESAPPQG